MRERSRSQDWVFHPLAMILAVLLVLSLMPSRVESQVASNDAITLLEPLHGAVFAPQIAPTFHWQSSQYTLFQVQFSADLTFPAGETVNLPAGEKVTSDFSLVPK